MYIYVLLSQVLLMILMLMFGLPIFEMMLGNICANMEKAQALVTYGMDQLHIMFSSTQFYENKTQCDLDPFCKRNIERFNDVWYMDNYVSNITIAGMRGKTNARPIGVCQKHLALPHTQIHNTNTLGTDIRESVARPGQACN